MLYELDDRALVRVAGEGAEGFLQNIVTNDVRGAAGDAIVYSCLLSPQGQVLNEFFIVKEGDGYLLDCPSGLAEDLVRRLAMYRLRAKIDIGVVAEGRVYAGDEGFADPRHPALGRRLYAREAREAGPRREYDDLCILHGVPPSSAVKWGKDYMTDLNLDLLNAVSFDKGCFVGQELAARMEHRGLAKRRLLVVEGGGLAAGDRLVQGEVEVGEVRAVDSGGGRGRGLALARLECLQRPDIPVLVAQKEAVKIHKPDYMN